MWISRQLSRQSDEPEAQSGKSTMNFNGNVEVVSTGVSRNVELYAPYGYEFSLPTGEKVLLTRCDGEHVGLGVKVKGAQIGAGEIRITAASGAYIYLKQDGSVIINGLKINKNGVIE